ncbi:hypothetical protein PU629_15130 [Pullulanibacillus sp. KACC 23026]|nr:hypothetical protein [Pullulanibacillus sp. KACC 23026]WEG11474.1 hypothetical protein PU629_15095 [Pullulanibacillus sp. KACC 23026]WEG11479.1 hypothetical protein PU629_15120 [Pullulanibacillus sp. KACC 23026]WEG11481.1 hypothetical protein PU629_15130 [Pullulanibacillus sp. KACC 23026]
MAFIDGMNAKKREWGSWKGVHQGYERQNRVESRQEWRSSRV